MPSQTRRKTKYGLGRASSEVELTLPSGNLCLVIRPGVQGLIKAGLLDSIDTLTSIVQVEHIDANDPKAMARAALEAAKTPEKLLEGMEIVDKTCLFVIKAPTVGWQSKHVEGEPEPEIWIEDVDLDDKMFIFQFVVGGTRDLESFRSQREAAMAHLSDGEAVQEPPQRDPGD